MGAQVYARRPFGYNGKDLDRGQVFTLVGARNDEKLTRLGYCTPYNGKAKDLAECPACGAQFIGGDERAGHYEKRHVKLDLTPEQEDMRTDREERMLAETSPIFMDKVAA